MLIWIIAGGRALGDLAISGEELTMTRPMHLPGQSAPESATYEQMNIFGSPTSIRIKMMHGHPLPEAPVGHSWAVVEGDTDES
jgi:hypothetical protein